MQQAAGAAHASEHDQAEPARRRFGMVRWFQPETLIGRVRQERAMRAGTLRGLPTAFGALDTQAGEL
jgi:hypothetical protein